MVLGTSFAVTAKQEHHCSDATNHMPSSVHVDCTAGENIVRSSKQAIGSAPVSMLEMRGKRSALLREQLLPSSSWLRPSPYLGQSFPPASS